MDILNVTKEQLIDYFGKSLKNDDGSIIIDVESNLIYEFVFMGIKYKKFMEQESE